MAQILAVCVGLWESVTGLGGRKQVLVCLAGPVTLMALTMLAGFYWSGAPSPHAVLTFLAVLPMLFVPIIMLASVIFVPSWVAVMVGTLVKRRYWTASAEREIPS